MAARSTGIFPREGFNLDKAFEVTDTATPAPVTLSNIRTFRVIIVGVQVTPAVGDGGPAAFGYQIGNKIVGFTAADLLAAADSNGVVIQHHRGFSIDGNLVDYDITQGADNTGTGQQIAIGGMFIELVDGPVY